MKVLLFTGHGKNYVTPKMRKIMHKDGKGQLFSVPARSNSVISYIEENASEYNSIMDDASLEELSSGDESIINFKESPNQYFVKEGDNIYSFSIINIEDNRQWTIQSNNGIERLEYIDTFSSKEVV